MSKDATSPTQALKYWKSLGEYTDSPKFRNWAQREFPEGASEATDPDRRNFLKLMGASFGLAGMGLAGCRYPEKTILPYARQPESIIPGVALYYATSLPGSMENLPLIVETHSARPTKVEGNPSYQPNGGGSTAFAQASVLDLYDPDRLKASLARGKGDMTLADVRALVAELNKTYGEKQGQGLALLLEPSTSPTRARLLKQLKKALPKARVAEYEPVDQSNPERALQAIHGKRLRAIHHLDKASRILALDSDCLATGAAHLTNAKAFAKARKVDSSKEADKMNRLYAVESNYTLTGAMADHRLRLATSDVLPFASLVLAELLSQIDATAYAPGIRDLRSQARAIRARNKETSELDWVRACVSDLVEASREHKSVVIAGAHLPTEVHKIVYLINALLEAQQHTVSYAELPGSTAQSLTSLLADINKDSVETLVVMGGNPAYNAPADLKWQSVSKRLKQLIRVGYYDDETAQDADTIIAQSHYLESWGDGRAWDGTYVPVQPMIEPLFATISELDFLAILVSGEAIEGQAYELVHDTFESLSGKEGTQLELAFNQWLAEGVWADSAHAIFDETPNRPMIFELIREVSSYTISASAPKPDSLEVRIIPSTHAYDGRYNNNGWLMECPDPMTKLTWDNAIFVSPKLAKALEIAPGHRYGHIKTNLAEFRQNREFAPMGELVVNGAKLRGPLHIQPGLADHTVVVQLGFGRRNTGRVGTEIGGEGKGIGFDVYPIVTADSPALATGARLSVVADQSMILANTQEHWSMEGRAIIREANAEAYKEDPHFVDHMGMESHSPPILGADKDKPLEYVAKNIPRGGSAYGHPSLNEPPSNVPVWNTEAGKAAFKAEQQWGMSIDLNTCIGCNACVVACQSENNIPIVGKDQVSRGREMHWIRLDRYYSAGPDADSSEIPEDPQVSFMSLACTHCELAPCESVCPVNATVHDRQGLNVMAYNRCVGTRYCSNNCPYKVRRFNFFDYNKRLPGEHYQGPLGTNYEATQDSQLSRLQKNPDVTIRMRGVMEKCTYCVQRIEEAKIHQKNTAMKNGTPAAVEVPDGAIKVACQQTCPTDAIQFGDITDTTSKVYEAKQSDRDYSVLGYLNIRPRTTYQAKLRNPNPKMPDYHKQPLSKLEYKATQPKIEPRDGSHGHQEATTHEASDHHEAHSEGAHH